MPGLSYVIVGVIILLFTYNFASQPGKGQSGLILVYPIMIGIISIMIGLSQFGGSLVESAINKYT